MPVATRTSSRRKKQAGRSRSQTPPPPTLRATRRHDSGKKNAGTAGPPRMSCIERWRAEIVVCVVLPVSLFLWLFKSLARWLFAPSPEKHDARVARVATDVKKMAKGGRLCRTDRSVFDSHSVRNSDKSRSAKVPLRDLRAILGLDRAKSLVHVEPGATVGEVTTFLLKRGMMLECCLEMEDATLGGLAMAQGMTTHSHVCGLLSETVVEYEVVLGTGDVVVATEDGPHAKLFRALPLSHGTLGLLVGLKLRVVPAKPWVRLSYIPCKTRGGLAARYVRVLHKVEGAGAGAGTGAGAGEAAPFFVEAVAFSPTTAVLMTGDLADAPPPGAVVNRQGRWYKPWFFKHVEGMLELPRAGKATTDTEGGGNANEDGDRDSVGVGVVREEYIPIRDYLMRHDRSMCMTMATIIPYGNTWWFRLALGWLLPPQMSFLKASHTAETREASVRKQVYQDVAFPAHRLPEALRTNEKLFGIWPVLVYPCALRTDREGALLRVRDDGPDSGSGSGSESKTRNGGTSRAKKANNSPTSKGRRVFYLNLGIYGVPPVLAEKGPDAFPTLTRVRALEAWLRQVGGFQHTYCDSFQTQGEFEEMFDHTGHYRACRKATGAEGIFPSIYEKTRPEVDVWAWLEQEQQRQRKNGRS